MIEWDQAELIAYLLEHHDSAELAVRETPDPWTAHGALHDAVGAIREIRSSGEPGEPVPRHCGVRMDDGVPVLYLDVQDPDWPRLAGQVVALTVRELEAAAVTGRLEPLETSWRTFPPEDFEYEADIMGGADVAGELDARGLPPGFPQGFPVPARCTLAAAQRAPEGEGTWEHVAWCCPAAQPLEEHLERLRDFGCELEPASRRSSPEFGGLHGYHFRHPLGSGSAWLYHQRLEDDPYQERDAPSAWYLSVVWQAAGTGTADDLPEPVL
jgi:hypothetical protein